MRATQFWILLLVSAVVSLLLIKQMFLGRTLAQKERDLGDSQQTAEASQAYENAWKQLALHIFDASRQDPRLTDILKKEDVIVHTRSAPAPGAATPPAANPTAVKTPAGTAHTAPNAP